MKPDKKADTAEMLKLYLRDRYALDTEMKVQEWMANNPDSEELEQASREYWNEIHPGKDAATYKALKRVQMAAGIHSENRRTVRLRILSRVAAVFILLIGIGGGWYYLHQQNLPAMVLISAAYGETRQVTLPDQTEVWLNAGSSLEYPSEFSRKIRSVTLTGEAFFTVSKNKQKPFVVATKNLTVRVLGTKFNLKAYPDESQTVATLQEGKIEVQTENRQKQQLEPNEQLVYNRETSTCKVEKIDPREIPDWKNGSFQFTEATLGKILQSIERQFNVKFDVDQSIDLQTEHYTIRFERDENPEQILQVLAEVAGDFSYSEKNGVMVLKMNRKNP